MPQIRIWAPKSTDVHIDIVDGETLAAQPDGTGYFTAELETGTRYFVRLDSGMQLPDPRSMRQPEGPHGPSEVVDPTTFTWSDDEWQGKDLGGAVFYELHIGTFSPEGTFRGAIEKLDHLKELGVDVVEIMPINPMPGNHGWGYDSVSIFAIHEPYGTPEDLVALVDAIHERGMSVCLDVVYNHFGPDGNYLGQFGPYFTDEHVTPWGEAVNLDDEGSEEVRKYFIDNAKQWLRDYHFDALRLDATDHLVDDSEMHFMAELAMEISELSVELERKLTLTAESDLNMPAMVSPVAEGGRGMHMQWTDDVHHALHVWLTGETNAYYVDHADPERMPNAFMHAFTRVGQKSRFEGDSKGSPVPHEFSGHHFIVFDENHDQVGNRLIGDRPTAKLSAGEIALSRALILTSHYTPMLFMGEEWGSKSPFHFFTDHGEEIGPLIMDGRKKEFERWDMTSVYGDAPVTMLDPQSVQALDESRLDWTEKDRADHTRMHDFVRSLIELRKTNEHIATGDRSSTLMHIDSDGLSGWMRRGQVLVVFTRSTEPVTVKAPLHGHTELLSWDPVEIGEDSISFSGPGVAIVSAEEATE